MNNNNNTNNYSTNSMVDQMEFPKKTQKIGIPMKNNTSNNIKNADKTSLSSFAFDPMQMSVSPPGRGFMRQLQHRIDYYSPESE